MNHPIPLYPVPGFFKGARERIQDVSRPKVYWLTVNKTNGLMLGIRIMTIEIKDEIREHSRE